MEENKQSEGTKEESDNTGNSQLSLSILVTKNKKEPMDVRVREMLSMKGDIWHKEHLRLLLRINQHVILL